LAVAQTGSLSAASRRLGVSQPTVGRQIAELEAQLDATLFERGARGFRLTELGQSILESASRMEGEALAVERRISGRAAELSGAVRVSASEGIGALWLTEKLAPMRATHPALAIEIALDNQPVDLGRREADIAVRLFRPKQRDLVARKVGKLAFGLYASPEYLARKGAPKRLSDLAEHDLILSTESPVPSFASWFVAAARGARVVYRSNSLIAQIEAAKRGWGITVAACCVAGVAGGTARVLPDAPIPTNEVWIVLHGDMRTSARVRAVYQAIATAFTKHAREVSGR
jgi:DNA-binding transcriptional LysR family regulator